MSGADRQLRLILASASPRRAAILRRLGLAFEAVPSGVAEEHLEDEEPTRYVERLAREKVEAVARNRSNALVLGGDTVVVLDGSILGKPEGDEEALEMLLRLSGRTHRVITGLALADPMGRLHVGSSATDVTFRRFGPAEVAAYVETGEPRDKAGAYGIQARGAALVTDVSGDYFSVVGLPVALFVDLLAAAGWRYAFGTLERDSP